MAKNARRREMRIFVGKNEYLESRGRHRRRDVSVESVIAAPDDCRCDDGVEGERECMVANVEGAEPEIAWVGFDGEAYRLVEWLWR